jgi:hypothetical protein
MRGLPASRSRQGARDDRPLTTPPRSRSRPAHRSVAPQASGGPRTEAPPKRRSCALPPRHEDVTGARDERARFPREADTIPAARRTSSVDETPPMSGVRMRAGAGAYLASDLTPRPRPVTLIDGVHDGIRGLSPGSEAAARERIFAGGDSEADSDPSKWAGRVSTKLRFYRRRAPLAARCECANANMGYSRSLVVP